MFQKAESHTASHPSHSVSSSKSQIQPRVPKVTQLMHFRVEIQILDADSRAFSTRKYFMQLSLQDHFFFSSSFSTPGLFHLPLRSYRPNKSHFNLRERCHVLLLLPQKSPPVSKRAATSLVLSKPLPAFSLLYPYKVVFRFQPEHILLELSKSSSFQIG